MSDVLYPTDAVERPTIGVDVSKDTLDVAGGGLKSSVPNTMVACRKLAKRLGRQSPRVVAVEATGGYERLLVQALWDLDIPVAVLQPSRVRAHARSAGQLAKTDGIDAANLVDFARTMMVRLTPKPSPETQKLRVLCDRREQIVQDRVREIGRLEATHDASMQREVRRHIKQLAKLEVDLDRRIEELIKRFDSLRSKCEVLRRQRGVGPVVSATLLSYMPELGLVNRQAIAALGGLAPYANESGRWKGRRSIFAGRAQIRRALYLAAMSAVRHEGPARDRYRAMVAQGKAKKVALIACARKLLVTLNAQMAEHLAASNLEAATPSAP